MSNKMSPMFVTRFVGNESQNVFQKTFGSPSKNIDLKKKEKKKKQNKKTRMTITKLFPLHANAIISSS